MERYRSDLLEEQAICVGIGSRLGAKLLDFLFVSLLLLIIIVNQELSEDLKDLLTRVTLVLGYFIIVPLIIGGSPGKRIMKLKTLDKDRKHMNLLKATIRLSPYLLVTTIILLDLSCFSGYTSVLVLLVIVFLIVDTFYSVISISNRALHDHMAGTFVIKDEYNIKHEHIDIDYKEGGNNG